MLTLYEAIAKINETVQPLSPARLPVLDAVGCTVTSPIRAPINVPDFACSVMDGIAFRFEDLAGPGPWSIPIQATVAAGNNGAGKLLPGQAVKIMTGAPLPSGADTVIKIEDVRIQNGSVTITDRTSKSKYVRPRGDDIKKDEVIYDRGTILTAVDTGVLASVGLSEIEVIPYPKVALISTGSEIVEPGNQLKVGQRFDSNSNVLKALFKKNGYPVEKVHNIIPDESEKLQVVLEECLKHYDLVVTSGGVSMGDYDFVPDIIRKIGGNILFHKVRVKPGKPVLVVNVGKNWLVGLPGNPVSVVAGYHLHVKRVISRLMGASYQPQSARARVTEGFAFNTDRFGMVGARIEIRSDGVTATPSLRQDSGRLSSIKGINGFIMLEEKKHTVSEGETVNVEWLY